MPCALLSAASACAPKVELRPIYPPRADLMVESKPLAGDEVVTSARAAAEYDNAVKAWGERGWAAVARVCRWAEANGAAVECPTAQ